MKKPIKLWCAVGRHYFDGRKESGTLDERGWCCREHSRRPPPLRDLWQADP